MQWLDGQAFAQGQLIVVLVVVGSLLAAIARGDYGCRFLKVGIGMLCVSSNGRDAVV